MGVCGKHYWLSRHVSPLCSSLYPLTLLFFNVGDVEGLKYLRSDILNVRKVEGLNFLVTKGEKLLWYVFTSPP